MPKLSDTQTLLLSHASQREGGSFYPLPETLAPGGGRTKALAALLRSGFAEERETSDAGATHRQEGGLRFSLFITADGLKAIGIEPAAQPPAGEQLGAAVAPCAEPAPARRTKAAAVLALLQREQGATLPS